MGASVITVRSENVTGPMGDTLDPEEIKELEEINRLKALMRPTEGNWKQVYQWPGYSEALKDLAGGWSYADAMRNLIAYEFPLSLMKAAVLYKDWEVHSVVTKSSDSEYDVAQTIAEECTYLLNSIRNPQTSVTQDFREVLWNILDGCHHGFSAQEKIWRKETDGPLKGNWVLKRLVSRHPQDIGFDLDADTLEVLHVVRRFAPNGQNALERHIPVEKFLLYTFKPFKGLPYGMGHFRPCYKPAHFISSMYRLWGRAQEKTGIPFPWLISNSSKPSIITAQRELLDEMAQGNAVVFPPGVQADWVNATNGVSDGFERAVLHQKGEIIHLILFQNLTTNADGKSSYALGEVHQSTQEFALSQIRRDVEQIAQGLLRDYVRYNWGNAFLHLTPRLSLGLWGISELNAIADMLGKFFKMGVLIAHEEEDNAWARKVAKLKPRESTDPLDNPNDLQRELASMRQPAPVPAGQ